jgi:hypothetical protein
MDSGFLFVLTVYCLFQDWALNTARHFTHSHPLSFCLASALITTSFQHWIMEVTGSGDPLKDGRPQ